MELAKTRPAVATDLPRIAELVLETWKYAYGGLVPQKVLADLVRTANTTNMHVALL